MVITIGIDRYLIVDGKKTFGCPSYGILADPKDMISGITIKPDTYLQANKNFTYSIQVGLHTTYRDSVIPMAKKSGIPFLKEGWNMPATPIVIIEPLFVGYLAKDEPLDTDFVEIQRLYNKMKTTDPSRFMQQNVWHNGLKWSSVCDILTWDNYAWGTGAWGLTHPRENSLYWWEKQCQDAFYEGNDLASIKTIMPVLQSIGAEYTDPSNPSAHLFVLTPKELRAQAYAGICQNVHGIVWLHSMGWSIGLDGNLILQTLAQQVAAEIKLLNEYLVSDTQAYFWYGRSLNPSKVSITGIQKNINGVMINNFSWILKQGLLIVVNKDYMPVTTTITVQGLGTTIIRTLGLESSGSGRSGRTISTSSGKFTDTFDGLAVHIYQIGETTINPTQWTISGEKGMTGSVARNAVTKILEWNITSPVQKTLLFGTSGYDIPGTYVDENGIDQIVAILYEPWNKVYLSVNYSESNYSLLPFSEVDIRDQGIGVTKRVCIGTCSELPPCLPPQCDFTITQGSE